VKVMATQAYCVKCKAKREMKGEKQVTMKNGRKAISGTCTKCGTNMFKIGGSSEGVGSRVKSKGKAKVALKSGAKSKAKEKVKGKKQ
jgi:RNase P subunit RPR2